MPIRKRSTERVAVDGRDTRPDSLARELIAHMDRVMRRLVMAGPEDTPMAFSRSEIGAVDTLGAEGPMTMGELAARVRLPLSTATRLVDRLVTRGIVQRQRVEDNRRIVRVALATGGRKFYDRAAATRIAGARRMLERLSDDEGRELVRLICKISASLVDESRE